ncbi:hypothetical protein [Actinoplanes sp. NPDC023714]|uniref:hypothetical protein n=1 Tax=Actinoplanes sp. NPDC023714 TaxID=3154322 RepID=UPI0033C3A6D9
MNSTRFVFLDKPLETTQVGPDAFVDSYPTVAKPQFEVSRAGDTVRIQLSAQDAGYQTALEWPSEEAAPVELGPAVLQALDDAGGKKSRDLAEQIRAFIGEAEK